MELVFIVRTLFVLMLCVLSGCFRLSGDSWYEGPPPRPASMSMYYQPTSSYGSFRDEILQTTDNYTLHHYTIDSYAGPIVIDFFLGKKFSENLVLVFPVLGGKNFIEKHIAK